MRMSLAAVAYDSYGLVLKQGEITVILVKDRIFGVEVFHDFIILS